MFGTKKDDNQVEEKKDPVFDPKSIPTHTMEDDLNMLDGKVVTSSAPRPENNPIQKKEIPNLPIEDSSPFLKATAPLPIPVKANNQPKVAENPFSKPKEVVLPPVNGKPVPTSQPHNWAKVTWSLVSLVAFLAALGGGYYFYMTRYNVPVAEIQVPEEVIAPVEVTPEPIVLEKFSVDKPNYLMLDVEEMEIADIQKLIIQKAAEIRQDEKNVPIEFVVVDKNNNPIAFKIFALLMKMNFSPKMIDNLTDDFSLLIYSDQDKVRSGLVLNSKNSIKLDSDLKMEEKTLAKTLNSLFLGEQTKTVLGTFSGSTEGGAVIRYLNLNEQNDLSIDYWTEDGKLFIATSKNTGRAIIAKTSNLEE